jgi:hypothetical protein
MKLHYFIMVIFVLLFVTVIISGCSQPTSVPSATPGTTPTPVPANSTGQGQTTTPAPSGTVSPGPTVTPTPVYGIGQGPIRTANIAYLESKSEGYPVTYTGFYLLSYTTEYGPSQEPVHTMYGERVKELGKLVPPGEYSEDERWARNQGGWLNAPLYDKAVVYEGKTFGLLDSVFYRNFEIMNWSGARQIQYIKAG